MLSLRNLPTITTTQEAKNKYQPKSIIDFGTKTLSNKNLIQKYDTLIIDSYESFSPKKLDQILYFMKKGKNIIFN